MVFSLQKAAFRFTLTTIYELLELKLLVAESLVWTISEENTSTEESEQEDDKESVKFTRCSPECLRILPPVWMRCLLSFEESSSDSLF
ncbi:hypothetical protein TNIN_229051 [Trichonephila inaurata madagascariensis]|uniref:Uncharacterized protein n=1 Tax=Trichonephila inaurata madagascariensis TaxID=2747483 RepID=A0A8X6YSW9_9ARAC|nr:hypothetical protein TNIN_229051 [Trichonephila inaurata madagascariensis]